MEEQLESTSNWAKEAYLASQLLEGIIRTAPVRVFWKDLNLVYLGCNDLFASDAGFTEPKDLIGKDDYQMTWRDQAELYRSDDRQVIASGFEKLLIEEPQTTPEGNSITLLTSKIPLRSPKGEIIGVVGTYMDITVRKHAEEQRDRLIVELQKSLAEVKTLSGLLPICMHCKKIYKITCRTRRSNGRKNPRRLALRYKLTMICRC
ncbi:MAG: PAS domain-containing protein [Desulfobacterales bacterium]